MWFDYALIAAGGFLAALVVGSAGFAFAIVVTGVWIYVLPPAQIVFLAAICATLLHIASIAREVRQRGHDYRCALIAADRVAAPADIAAWLGLRSGQSVFHSVCLHLENEVPVQFEDRYVNPQVVPDFLGQDFSVVPPGEYLVQNVPFDEIEHVVDAVLPTPEQASRLQIDTSEPCLLLTRRTWTRTTPVTMVRCLHPSSRYRLGCRFDAVGNQRFD